MGTDLGVYVSINGGTYWHLLANNLPTTFVHDLVIHPRDNILVAATHGRGMYAMDVSQLQEMTEELVAKKLHLFETMPAKLPRKIWRQWVGGIPACIYYYLENAQTVTLVIKDKPGKTIKKIKGTGDAGLNTAAWDLTSAPTAKKREKEEEPRKIYVKPGKYTVVVTAGSVSLGGTIEVKK